MMFSVNELYRAREQAADKRGIRHSVTRRPTNPTSRSIRIKPRPEKAPRPPQKRSNGQIVGGWFKEEPFYRDIATRSLAAVLVTLVLYVGGVTLGYIGTPPAKAVFLLISAVAMAIVAGLVWYAYLNKRPLRATIIAFVACTATFAANQYGVQRFGSVDWTDWTEKWNLVATAVLAALFVVIAVIVQSRHRARSAG